MSVTTELTLPDQPVSGSLKYEPLGGDGYTSPMGAYNVRVNSASDASGNYNVVSIGFDDQYLCLVSAINIGVEGAAANVPFYCIFQCGPQDNVQKSDDLELSAITGVSAKLANYLWEPPALLCSGPPRGASLTAPYVSAYVDNTNGETLSLGLRMYLFAKDARERVPVWALVRNLQR